VIAAIVHGEQSFSRRRALAGAAGFGLALTLGRSVGFAQEASPAETGTEASWIKFNLNAAGEEQFLTIPAVGDRMVREFFEYRPYMTIDQFRREIGKYVDDDQVAAYEDYLFVPIDPANLDEATLQQLPGIDADKAATLAGGGPYADDAAFLAALGGLVSAEQASAANAYLAATAADTASWVKFNLNTAGEAQFLTIPGVGEQMVDEFFEYRPYTTIAQFRQEIGKYVDEAQVAAYEGYVFVPIDPSSADEATLQQLPGVDADKAAALAGAEPFADAESFLAALSEQVSAAQVDAARGFLAVAAS
jgi:DNA uptake protein ComE-like DNA-binding protein